MGSRILFALALCVAAAATLPALAGTFVLDDPVAVQQSACVTGALDLRRIVGSNFWCEPGPLFSIQSWRPLTVLVWWFLYALGGSALPFHVLNTALHVACTALSIDVGRRLGLSDAAAGVGGIVFASLAIHVDAFALVVGGADLWAALFVLLAVRATLAGRWTSVLWCALAVLSKETGVLAVAVVATVTAAGPLAAAAGTDDRRAGLHRAWARVAAAAVATAGILFARAAALGAWTGTHIPAFVNPLVESDASTRLVAGVAIVGRYHRVAAAANPLSADYAHAALGVGEHVSGLDLGVGLVAGAGWLALLWARRRDPGIRVLCVWVLGTCLFVSNVPFLLPAVFAERLFYVPSIAIALLLGIAADRAAARLHVRPIIIRGGLGLFVAFQLTVSMLHAWRYTDETRIIEATVEATPNNARARVWLAKRRLDAGDHESARDHAAVAARIRPQWGTPLAYIAIAEDLDGRPEAAAQHFRDALARDPADPEVVNLFIQFLLRYGNGRHAALVYRTHVQARGSPHPDVTAPPALPPRGR